jgi:DNA-binding transcriptional regulator GbsR (MarR family)
MNQETEQFIERAGVLWEQDGLPRIAGRIFALAMISKDALSLDEIAETLGVSKASVSNDTRLLERLGYIDRVSRPGDRRDYYQSTPRSFEQAIVERVRRLEQLEALIESGRRLAVDSDEVRERLESHHIAFTHVTKALQSALEEIRMKRNAGATRA